MPAKLQHPFTPPKSSVFKEALNPTVIGTLSAAAAALFSVKGREVLDKDGFFGGGVSNHLFVSLVGFIVGYGAFRLCDWLRVKALTSLFTYRGWVTQPKSTKTKLWALLLSLLRGQGPFNTFQFQQLLPKQPLPRLDDTLDRWLKVAENFQTPDDFELTKEVVEDFRRNEGPKVQAFLEKKAEENDSWIYDYWLNGAYLSSRQPIAITSNYFLSNCHESADVEPLARVATLTHWMARLEQMLSTETFPPVFIQNLAPLCMHGFSFIFNCNRIPGEYIDELVRYPGHGHIIVIRNSQYFKVDLYRADTDGENSILTPLEIKLQFEKIIKAAAGLEKQPPIAVLTAQRRDTWAKQRKELLVQNKDVVRDIDTCMFVVTLEENAPKDYAELSRTSLVGNGDNIWFDKCVTISAFSNGWIANNIEHSAFDAMITINMQEYILALSEYENNDVIKTKTPRNLPPPSLLKWDLTNMVENINTAMAEYQTFADTIKLHVLPAPYGKGYMKKQRLSPDGYIQMSLQLTYYRMHKHIPKTYEPSTHRLFHLGRTETVHPASEYSIAWVKAMDDPSASSRTKKDLLKKAVASQTNTRLQATIGEGCDRHLMAMLCASRELGMDLPKIFTDKAWQMPFLLSTSQTPNNFAEYDCKLQLNSCVGGFGTTAHDGYGVAYCVLGDDIINFQVTSWSTSKIADSEKFVQTLKEVFDDMKALFSQ